MICEYCRYKNSWDCGDGWNRRENCDSFTPEWDWIPDDIKQIVIALLRHKEDYYE